MADRERLTALLMAGAGDFIKKNGALNCTKLADYLLEHGIIVLPCKVGDTVYIVYDDDYEDFVVTEICCGTLGASRVCAECNVHGKRDIFQCEEEYCGRSFCKTSFEFREFGKTVFLTREEAERALKERENNA